MIDKNTTPSPCPYLSECRYAVDKNNATDEFEIQLVLTYCIDEQCNDIDLHHDIPIPVCNPHFSNYTLSGELSLLAAGL